MQGFFFLNWLLLSLWTIANHEIFVILHLVLTFWLARLCQLRQSETIRACACAVLDDQRMRELCWFGQRCQPLSYINAHEGLLGWEGDPSTRGKFSSYKWSLRFPWGGRSIACCDRKGWRTVTTFRYFEQQQFAVCPLWKDVLFQPLFKAPWTFDRKVQYGFSCLCGFFGLGIWAVVSFWNGQRGQSFSYINPR